jgi:hypothetical protein
MYSSLLLLSLFTCIFVQKLTALDLAKDFMAGVEKRDVMEAMIDVGRVEALERKRGVHLQFKTGEVLITYKKYPPKIELTFRVEMDETNYFYKERISIEE